jgi:hypothetical protein
MGRNPVGSGDALSMRRFNAYGAGESIGAKREL